LLDLGGWMEVVVLDTAELLCAELGDNQDDG
jgi:hypothetical protein